VTKRDTAEDFRQRLGELVTRTGLSRAGFARKAELDRSTLSQLLSGASVRLPSAETIARIAARHNVSIDWLLGLSQHDQIAADIVPEMRIEPDSDSPVDERLRRWHEEAWGAKIRYVPATLPDQLKIPAVIAYETRRLPQPTAEAWAAAAHTQIEHARRPETDIEVCSALQGVEAFAAGEGVWRGLPAGVRKEQLAHMATLADDLYPTYRWFLFDGRERGSVPFTVFGQKRAALYVGDMFFVFTSTEHIRALARHFDGLIRDARIHAHETVTFLRRLEAAIE
jgi:transcriptional regulator with XRE-family HTH domain